MDLGRRCVEFSPPMPFPKAMLETVDALTAAGFVKPDHKNACDYLAINEYKAPGGIESHVDRYTDSEQILILSLLEDCVMDLTYHGDIRKKSTSAEITTIPRPTSSHLRVLLPRASLLVMRDAARWAWAHGIGFDKVHAFDENTSVAREHRLSLTFLVHPNTT